MTFWRILASGAAAAAAWLLGLFVVFGPAQRILANPELQSAKFLMVFSEAPMPRMAEQPGVLPAGLFLIGLVYACVFEWLGRRLPGAPLRKGLTFGILAWALMTPWFEFYLPWNVMREPLPLVLLETACWLGVLLGVGVALSLVHSRIGTGGVSR